MTELTRVFSMALASLTFGSGMVQPAHGQNPIPVRDLPAVDRIATDTLGSVVSVRVMSDGRILINDAVKYRVKLCNATLDDCRIVQQFTQAQTSVALMPYVGDSSLYLDPSSQTFLVFDREGQVARVMALAHPQDARAIAFTWQTGAPLLDPRGRLMYLGTAPTTPTLLGGKLSVPVQSDYAPLVRADFDTRRVDTLAQLKSRDWPKMVLADDVHGVSTLTLTANPFDKIDAWSMLSDGTIAIVRANDYHVDWILLDGTQHASDRMPYDWVRLDNAEKQRKLDSLKKARPNFGYDTLVDVTFPMQGGPTKGKQLTKFMSMSEISDYESSLGNNAVAADQSGRLWIMPRFTRDAANGLVYDVVGKDGKVMDRVRLPKDHVLVGFGPDEAVFVARVEKGMAFLGRTRFK